MRAVQIPQDRSAAADFSRKQAVMRDDQTDLDYKAPLVAGCLQRAGCQGESSMNDVLPVQLGHAQASLPGTAEQSNQVHIASTVQQPPVVHSMLHHNPVQSVTQADSMATVRRGAKVRRGLPKLVSPALLSRAARPVLSS